MKTKISSRNPLFLLYALISLSICILFILIGPFSFEKFGAIISGVLIAIWIISGGSVPLFLILFALKTGPKYKLKNINRLIAKDPKNCELLEMRGRLNISLQNFREGISDITIVLRKNKSNNDLLLLRGVSAFVLGEYKKAILDFDKVLSSKKVKYKGLVYYQRGQAYSLFHKSKLAIEDFNKALKSKLSLHYKGEVYSSRGQLKLNLKDYKGALKDLNKAINILPNNGYAYYNKGIIYFIQNRLGIARTNFNIAKKLGYAMAIAQLNELDNIERLRGKK